MRALLAICLAASTAHADPACDHAVADANAALMSAPDVFLSAGSMPRSDFDEAFEPRLLGGVDYSLTRILAGSTTRGRASAKCRARAAASVIESAPLARALDARAASLTTAIADGEAALARLESAAQQQLATRPDLVAMRIDLDALRAALATTRRERAALPAPSTLSRAIADEESALADLEKRESRLRTLDGIDISVRGAVDRGLFVHDAQAYVAIVSVTFNTGLLFRGDANDRASKARVDMARGRIAALELAARKAEHAFLVARASATLELRR